MKKLPTEDGCRVLCLSEDREQKKVEAIKNLPTLFTRGASEVEKMRKQHEAEKEDMTKQPVDYRGQLVENTTSGDRSLHIFA